MKHLHSIILAAVTASVAMSSNGHAEDAAVLLKPTWKIGKTYTCEHAQNITITFGAGDQAIENPINVDLTFEAKVAAHGEDGGKAISFNTSRTKMSMSMFGTTSEYDSEDESKQSPELAGMISGILDTDDLKVIFDKNDKFVKFDDGGRANLKGSGGGAASLAPVRFGKNEIRQLLSYVVREFPERPIIKGDKWQEDNNVNLNVGSTDMKMEMTSEGNDKNGQPVVTYTSDFEVDFEEGGLASGGKGEGKMVGKMTYDPKQAIVCDHFATIEMGLSMNGMVLPVKQESTTKVIKVE
ncbi:MAG: hypothetical protein ACI9R3_005852 [Verrucomicrobiales bacterium]|jgi:hypothetical protein